MPHAFYAGMSPYQTIAATKAAIRATGLTVRYQAEYDEWRIDYKRDDPRWSEDSAYYTTYRDDAIATARVMAAIPKGRQA